jgi:hypothetical protein
MTAPNDGRMIKARPPEVVAGPLTAMTLVAPSGFEPPSPP